MPVLVTVDAAAATWLVEGVGLRAAATAAATSGERGFGRGDWVPVGPVDIRSIPATLWDVLMDRNKCKRHGAWALVVLADDKVGHAWTGCSAAGHGCCVNSDNSCLQLFLDIYGGRGVWFDDLQVQWFILYLFRNSIVARSSGTQTHLRAVET